MEKVNGKTQKLPLPMAMLVSVLYLWFSPVMLLIFSLKLVRFSLKKLWKFAFS
jgi:hypothetical protein